jgi:hypothetical protein
MSNERKVTADMVKVALAVAGGYGDYFVAAAKHLNAELAKPLPRKRVTIIRDGVEYSYPKPLTVEEAKGLPRVWCVDPTAERSRINVEAMGYYGKPGSANNAAHATEADATEHARAIGFLPHPPAGEAQG